MTPEDGELTVRDWLNPPESMTREESLHWDYRRHMRKYSRDTAVMSFLVTKHPDFQALQAMGGEIVPWLLADLLDPGWHCNSCYGDGFEYPAGWQEVWDRDRVWPENTGVPCHECGGKGNICVHACMRLLWENVDDAPKIERWMSGRVNVLTGLWRKWGEERGLLPATPGPEPGFLTRAFRALRGLFIINP
jgi:hypothetical protein